MTRKAAPAREEEIPEADPTELTDMERDQLAAGDIAFLGTADYQDYEWSIWRQRAMAEIAGDPRAPRWEFVLKVSGPIDATSMVPFLGGGVFHFRGYADLGDGRGKRMVRQPVIALAGPRKNLNGPAPVENASPPGAGGTVTSAETQRLDRLERMVEKLLERPAQTGTDPAAMFTAMLTGLAQLDQLRGRGGQAPNADMEVVKMALGMVDKGIEIAESRERPIAEGGDTAGTVLKIAETVGPIIGKMLDRLGSRRVVVNPRPAGPTAPPPGQEPPAAPREPSHAEVVVEDPEAEMVRAQYMVLVKCLDRAIREGESIENAADAVVLLIDERDLEAILAMPDAIVVQDFVKNAGGRFPELGSEAGQAYLTQVLAELRKPDPGDEIPVG